MLKSYIKTFIGPRENNEDYYLVDKIGENIVACVADGVGGNNCGEIASKLSVDLFYSSLSNNIFTNNLRELILNIDTQIKEYSLNNSVCIGMATTFSGCVIQNLILNGIHVGDSRITVLRGNGIKQLTEEQTESARLLHEKIITRQEFVNHYQRNILTSALGSSRDLKIQEFSFELQKKDRIILSTDGFHEIIGKLTLRNMSVMCQDIDDFGQQIEKYLLNSKLKDNSTFILLEI